MDKDWLEPELAGGRSIESLAQKAGRDPSTVAYWARKHGLVSQHAERHRSKGSISRETLAELVGRNLSVREIAAETGRSPTTVRYWLVQYGLETTGRARRQRRPRISRPGVCEKHGEVELVRNGEGVICVRCRADGVSAWRRRAKPRSSRRPAGAASCAVMTAASPPFNPSS